jgi:hypothetical protein
VTRFGSPLLKSTTLSPTLPLAQHEGTQPGFGFELFGVEQVVEDQVRSCLGRAYEDVRRNASHTLCSFPLFSTSYLGFLSLLVSESWNFGMIPVMICCVLCSLSKNPIRKCALLTLRGFDLVRHRCCVCHVKRCGASQPSCEVTISLKASIRSCRILAFLIRAFHLS